MLCYAMWRAVSKFLAFKFSCKCVENIESKGEKIMAFFNDVATSSQSYDALYGKQLNGFFDDIKPQTYDALYGKGPVREIPLGEPSKKDGKKEKAIVDKFILRREDGQLPCGSKKVVTLPDNSPLRKFGLDRFELTREKVCQFGSSDVAPGLKKTLKLFGQGSEPLFVGRDSIRKFMETIAHVIRKG